MKFSFYVLFFKLLYSLCKIFSGVMIQTAGCPRSWYFFLAFFVYCTGLIIHSLNHEYMNGERRRSSHSFLDM